MHASGEHATFFVMQNSSFLPFAVLHNTISRGIHLQSQVVVGVSQQIGVPHMKCFANIFACQIVVKSKVTNKSWEKLAARMQGCEDALSEVMS